MTGAIAKASRLGAVVLVAVLTSCGPSKSDVRSYERKNIQLFRELTLPESRVVKTRSDRYGTRTRWGLRTNRILIVESVSRPVALAGDAESALARRGWTCFRPTPGTLEPPLLNVSCSRGTAVFDISFRERPNGGYHVEIDTDWNDHVREYED